MGDLTNYYFAERQVLAWRVLYTKSAWEDQRKIRSLVNRPPNKVFYKLSMAIDQ